MASPLPRPPLQPRDDPTSSEYEFYPEQDSSGEYRGDLSNRPRRLPILPFVFSGSRPKESAKEVMKRHAEELPRHLTRQEYELLSQYSQNIFAVGGYGQALGMLLGLARWSQRPNSWPFLTTASTEAWVNDMRNGGTGGPGGATGSPFGGFSERGQAWGPQESNHETAKPQSQSQPQQQPQPQPQQPQPPKGEGPAEAIHQSQQQQNQQQQQSQQQQSQQQQSQQQSKARPKSWYGWNQATPEEIEILKERVRNSTFTERARWATMAAARSTAYIFVGHLLGGIIGVTVGGAWQSAEEEMDPRLATFFRERKAFIAHEVQHRRQEAIERQKRMPRRSPGTQPPPSPPSENEDTIGLYGNDAPEQGSVPAPVARPPIFSRRRAEAKRTDDDDLSLGGATADTEIFWGEEPPSESSDKTTNGSSSRSSWGRPSSERQQTRRETNAGRSHPSRDDSATTYDSGGSAWDRIRREASQSQSEGGEESAWSKARGGVGGAGRSGESKQDSFTFSDSDRRRSLAKEEAQKDFDERVEKERRGEEGWK